MEEIRFNLMVDKDGDLVYFVNEELNTVVVVSGWDILEPRITDRPYSDFIYPI